jgi:hypothetical protein
MDIYDLEIDYLQKHPEDIMLHYRKATPLFGYARHPDHYVAFIGCLVLIRRFSFAVAETDELTEGIRADENIPISDVDISVDNLHIFAQWQRRIDIILNRPVAASFLPR